MEIKSMKLEDLRVYKNNPRKNDEAVPYVAASIKEFGFKVPIIIDKDNVIIAGHTRYKAAKELKLKSVPVVVADDLTEEQVNAFRLIDNKTQELSSWDFNKLLDELNSLIDDIDMTQFGFAPIGEEEEGGDKASQDLDEGEELDLENFDDEKFECTCPACGFKFNE
jgi:ParB/RepB/Spo0J family partition protein